MLNKFLKEPKLVNTPLAFGLTDCITQILLADTAGVRARKVVKRSNARITSKYPGQKAGRMMQCESSHERNAMLLLDACPSVANLSEQPCVISYILDGQQHRHYPDLLVQGFGWKELWEIKTQEDARSFDISRRTSFLKKYLPSYGYGYRMVLAEDLSLNPRLENVKKLLRLGRVDIPLEAREKIRLLFKAHSYLSWGFFVSNSTDVSINYISRLILDGLLAIDIHQPISASTLITWVEKSQDERSGKWLESFFNVM